MVRSIQKIITTNEHSPTRGGGMLEPFLARRRAAKANRLIPTFHRSGRIMDIGCGSFPYFLSHTSFKEKFAIDQITPEKPSEDIRWYRLNLNTEPYLPFEKGYFDVITLLAVIEHLDQNSLISLLQECYRVLRPEGMVILTTPAAWSGNILRWMARMNLVSAEEIEEHVYEYTLPEIGWYFGKAGFEMEKIRFGYFELVFNMWATAVR
jgi:SAM-dependent methyltransferase